MANTGQIRSTATVGGISIQSTITRTGEGQISQRVDLPAGIAGQISAAGVDGLPTGHGFEASDVIAVHWVDANGVAKSRRGLTVDAASTNAIEFDETPAGAGDALPAADTDVVVSVQYSISVAFDGDDLEMIVAASTGQVAVDYRAAAASIAARTLTANESWSWISGEGVANPLEGETIASIVVSNGATSAATFLLGVLYDSVPEL